MQFIGGTHKEMTPLQNLWAEEVINNAVGDGMIYGDSKADTGVGMLLRHIDPLIAKQHEMYNQHATEPNEATSKVMRNCDAIKLIEIGRHKNKSKLSEENQNYVKLALTRMKKIHVYVFDVHTQGAINFIPPELQTDFLMSKSVYRQANISPDDASVIRAFVFHPRMLITMEKATVQEDGNIEFDVLIAERELHYGPSPYIVVNTRVVKM